MKDTGHIKLTEMVAKIREGEEEEYSRYGKMSGAWHRDREEDRQKRYCKQCHKQFTPSYEEYNRCPDCVSKQHSAGEKSTGVQEGEEEEYSRYGKMSGAWHRDREEDRQKRYCKQCHKQFTPSYEEYNRCPDCVSKQHSAGEKSTGVQ